MNILVLTPLIPYPPHDGDKLRLYHFLKHLKKKGHTIDLFCLTRVKEDMFENMALRPFCRTLYLEHLTRFDLFFNLIGGFLMGTSFNVASYFSPQLRDRLKDYWASNEGKSIDMVFVHRLRMAPAAFEGNPGKPVVLDLTDCLTAYTQQLSRQPGAPLLRRLAAKWDHWFLRKEEIAWPNQAAMTTIISQADANVLIGNGLEEEKITVVPNGVDLSGAEFKAKNVYPAKTPVVCFVGNMGYAPNEEGALWFIRTVWPLVKAKVPNAVFAAVGGSPRKILKKYHNGKDLLVTGYVPEVEPYLLNAQVSIAPLRFAGGMQNKVALSMGLGVPVVATSASTGWLPETGKGLVRIADDHEVFANEIITLLKNPATAKGRALKGKRFITQNYSWDKAGRQLESILKQATQA